MTTVITDNILLNAQKTSCNSIIWVASSSCFCSWPDGPQINPQYNEILLKSDSSKSNYCEANQFEQFQYTPEYSVEV